MHKQNTQFSQEEKYFLIRRLHSLTGIVPVGLFFLFHLFSNAKSLQGPEVFNKVIEEIAHTPYLPIVEMMTIALPLLFHAMLGIAIILTGKNNVTQQPHMNNWRYYFQRLTGLIALIYIGFHVYGTRISSLMQGQEMSYEWMQNLLQNSAVFWFYLIGVLSVTYHFANGLWTFLITWGVTVSPRSQALSSKLCLGLFLLLSAVWVNILLHFSGSI